MAIANGTRGQRPAVRRSRENRPAEGVRGTQTQALSIAQSFWQPSQAEFAQRTYGNRAMGNVAPTIQRAPALEDHEGVREGGAVAPKLEAHLTTIRGGSAPPTHETPTEMNQDFGANFSGVRNYTGASDPLNRAIDARAFATGNDIFFRDGACDPQSQAGQQTLAHRLPYVMQQGNARQAAQGAIQRSAETGIIQRELMSLGSFRKSSALPFGYKRSKQTKLALKEIRRVLERYHEYEAEHAGEPPYERVVFTKQAILRSLAHAIIDYKNGARYDKEVPYTKDQMELLNTQVFSEIVALERIQTVPNPVAQNRPQQSQPGGTGLSVNTMQFGARLTDEDRQRLGLGANQGNAPGGNGQGMPQPNQQQGQFFLDPDEVEFLQSLGNRGATYGGMKKRRRQR